MTGNLQTKKLASGKEYYYMVLNFRSEDGKRKQKWISTGLEVRGNKRKAEAMLREELQKYKNDLYSSDRDILFSDYLQKWLEQQRSSVSQVTFEGYSLHIRHPVAWFGERHLSLGDLKVSHFEDFYNEMLTSGKVNPRTGETSGLSVRTVREYKFIINSALNKAVANEIIPSNPALNIRVTNKTKKQLARKINFFTTEEANDFLDYVYGENDVLADLICATLFFGLRRSEVIAIRIQSIDFQNHRLNIDHTIVKMLTLQEKDDTKTPDSNRSYPLTGEMEDFFRRVIEKKKENAAYFGDTYQENEYVFTWDDGRPFAPDFVYHHFTRLIKKYGRPGFTFHNLRHSTASILYEQGWHPKDIQEWLGHADFYTTMNIYTHLDKCHRAEKARALDEILHIPSMPGRSSANAADGANHNADKAANDR
ncbi:MAG: tyrosine-type recombinase/integrase [Lachnospiraceae bacterium]|nr:tyrosine-type recombinase/integrase [Lachnospiraceae bacterium]